MTLRNLRKALMQGQDIQTQWAGTLLGKSRGRDRCRGKGRVHREGEGWVQEEGTGTQGGEGQVQRGEGQVHRAGKGRCKEGRGTRADPFRSGPPAEKYFGAEGHL